MKKLLFISIVLFVGGIAFTASATTYYLDATGGNDSASGISVEEAWKSLEKVKSLALKPGDKILLKKGEIFHGELHIQAKGEANNPVIIDQYGEAVASPCIKGYSHSLYAVYVFNSEYVEIRNLEIVNTGNERLPSRTGIKVHLKDYGIAHSTTLKGLYIHDVNGSLVKKKGGGSGILIVNEGKEVLSAFNGLLIEDCIIRRCERNAMIWSGYSSRANWFPNRNVVVRKNLIDQVPGDGIVPIGCVNTLIEYNKMQNCPALLPETEAAAGIWPYSCDSTLIQYNEVCEHRAPWDAQGFDSDDNCMHTTIQYNYSHDNEGGFLLICTGGSTNKAYNIGTIGTVVKYNISINDATRRNYTVRRDRYFSPTIHIAGPCIDSYIERNILHVNIKPDVNVDRRMVAYDSYGDYADRTVFKENIFYTAEPSAFDITKSNYIFDGNYYLGIFQNMPKDPNKKTKLMYYQKYVENDPSGFHFLSNMMDICMIANGRAELRYVKKEAIETLFEIK
jgi:hypothetical protein